MKKMIHFIIVVIFTISSVYAQRYDAKMLLDGKMREFIVVKPTGSVPQDGYPVVFMLHGTGQDGEIFYNNTSWKELGEIEKFITVFPNSLAYCIEEDGIMRTTFKWNNGGLQSVACPGQDIKDDVKFIRKMVDTIKATFPINASMIFVSGFSNGGQMSAKLAIEMNDVFAASTSNGAGLNDLDSGAVAHKIPVWDMMGNQDSMFLDRSGKLYIPFNDSCLAYLQKPITNYLGSLRLTNIFTKDSNAVSINYDFKESLPNDEAGFYRFTIVKGMKHVYPNGSNYPVDVTPLHWAFFKNYKKLLAIKTVLKSEPLKLYPNPAQDEIIIDTENKIYSCEIFDILGKAMLTYNNLSQNTIDISSIPTGAYLLKIITSKGMQTNKFIKN
ncbi:MAG: T9SS type A sorting domain-containing protein [Saprospiraceae bacterium]|jgi:polyhydroxybutyrate depolymerase|nr:T9SS type A sorting domain-containing protein [Saprospiraceae bacterium]